MLKIHIVHTGLFMQVLNLSKHGKLLKYIAEPQRGTEFCYLFK